MNLARRPLVSNGLTLARDPHARRDQVAVRASAEDIDERLNVVRPTIVRILSFMSIIIPPPGGCQLAASFGAVVCLRGN